VKCGHDPSFSEGIQHILAESGGIGLRIFQLFLALVAAGFSG